MASASLVKRIGRGSVSWRLFFLLFGLGSWGLIALIPYGLTLAGQQLAWAQLAPLALQFVPQAATLAMQIGIGLLLGNRIGLGAPLLESWLKGEDVRLGLRSLWLPAVLGMAAGIITLILDLLVLGPALAKEASALGLAAPQNANPPAWQGLLASFYGGINEEILLRFFLMTVLAWLGSRFSRNADGEPTYGVMWASIILTGLALGIGHLPGAMALGLNPSPLYIFRTIVLNLGGILFGWMYWKRGLEWAMAAHFSMDIVLHVLGASILSA